MSKDPLKDLPRLGDEALGPCAICSRVLLGTGSPSFYRLRVSQSHPGSAWRCRWEAEPMGWPSPASSAPARSPLSN